MAEPNRQVVALPSTEHDAPVAPYFQHARSEIQRLVPSTARRVLDIGCASGALGEALKRERPGLEVVGIELDAQAAALAATRLDTVFTGSIDAIELPFPAGHFDCLVLADVLEHLPDPEATLSRLLPLLHDGGHVVLSLPNIRHHLPLCDLFFNGRFKYMDAGILDRTHLRFFTYREIVAWMARAGLNLVELDASVHVPDHGLMQVLAEVVTTFGYDAADFIQEASVVQYLMRLEKPLPNTPRGLGASRDLEGLAPAPAGQPPVASIVMLTLNQLHLTQQCVESIFAYSSVPFELIVIDNGSTDGTRVYLRELAQRDPRVRLHFNQTNMGFGHGCNQGIAMAEGEFVVLLNNDTVVTESWLEGLLRPMWQVEAIGATGPRTNMCSSNQKLAFVPYGHDMQEMQRFASWYSHHNRGQAWMTLRLIGFCMAVRRSVLEKIGGFDTTFGLGNFEDDDLSLRINTAGYRICVNNEVFIHHYGHATFRGESIDHTQQMLQNQDRFVEKWGAKITPERTYNIGELVRLPFDPARDVTPILLPEAPPAPIQDPKRFHFLTLPDWSRPERVLEAIAAFAQAFRAGDDVALLLWVDPAGRHTVGQVAEELGARLAERGIGGEGSPDLVLFDAPGDPMHIARVYRAAHACLPLGDAAIAAAAQACGLAVLDDLSATSLRRTAGFNA
ncbi:MAG TPA: glycosyltransferase [Oscillatoriaceae cyanobacterium]